MTVQLASRISWDLSRKFIKDPNVTVEVETPPAHSISSERSTSPASTPMSMP